MADPNTLLIHECKLCLMLICKAGNSSIKWAVAEAMGLSGTHRTDLHWPTPNKMDVKRYRDVDGYRAIAVVRHPLARLLSCWQDKVADPARFHAPFRRKYGRRVAPGMSFDAWVRFVASIEDGMADQHFRSMAWDLCDHDGVPIPEVLEIERPDWWELLRGEIRGHCGLDIGPERRVNVSPSGRPAAGAGSWEAAYSVELRRLAEARYAADFAAFPFYRRAGEVAA